MQTLENNDVIRQSYNEYLDEYLAVLTKLTQMAFVLGADYEFILEERKKQQEKRKEKIEEGDRHTLVLHAIDFVYDVAVEFEKFDLEDQMISVEIKNWDNIGDEVLGDIDTWIKYYTKEYLPENRKKDVEEFIANSNKFIANIKDKKRN
jgi:hypothetical protein